MKLRIVPARHGAIWVRSGFRIFIRRPLVFAMLFASFLVGVGLLVWLPIIGGLLSLMALPLVTQGFMIATQRALLERPVLPTVFAEPLRAGRPQAVAMLKIGLLYAVGAVLVMWLAGLADGGTLRAWQEAMMGGNPDPKQVEALMSDPRLGWGVLLRLALVGLLALPFWHSPALIHWGGQGWGKALFFSTVACWRNKAAFAVYALTWAAVMLGFGLIANVILVLLGQAQLVGFAALPVALMFSTIFYASLYFTFADCFEYSLDPASLDPRTP